MEEKEKKQTIIENTKTPKYTAVKSQNTNPFWKSIMIPFCSGAIGSLLVVGICFGIPGIRDSILANSSHETSTMPSTSEHTTNTNTNLVSLANYSDTAINVAQKVLPSIVGIKVEYTVNSMFGRGASASAEGSGIIMSEDGYILTNNHVVNSNDANSYYEVSEANNIMVYLYNDSNPYPARIIGTDSQTDLAVIKIEKTGLTKAEIGDSSSVQVGEFSMAIGNPLGMQSSVTSGIISAINRQVTDSDGKTYTLIQTDAAINSGNSGGALVNSKGEVIGVNTLKLNGTGIEGMGFAIPINSTTTIYEQLVQYQKVKRPYIGISGIDLDEKTAKANNLVPGVYVKSVETFSAAEKAGIQVGDVILSADDKDITKMDELNEIKNSHQIGDQITLKLNRNGKETVVKVTLQEQP